MQTRDMVLSVDHINRLFGKELFGAYQTHRIINERYVKAGLEGSIERSVCRELVYQTADAFLSGDAAIEWSKRNDHSSDGTVFSATVPLIFDVAELYKTAENYRRFMDERFNGRD